MNDKQKVTLPAIGGSSLLVIFAVLCLTVFALLSLSTVQADTRLSDASAEALTAYYEADLKAQAILAQLRSGEIPPTVSDDGYGCYSYECPVTETQTLYVAVEIQGSDYTIYQWQMLPTLEWESDDSLVVWDGEIFP